MHAAYSRDRARAVPMPLPAGTSALQNWWSLKAVGGTAGFAEDLCASEVGSARRAAQGSGGAPGCGAGGSTGATRELMASGRPIQNSAWSGFAIRSATNVPTDLPVTRLIT